MPGIMYRLRKKLLRYNSLFKAKFRTPCSFSKRVTPTTATTTAAATATTTTTTTTTTITATTTTAAERYMTVCDCLRSRPSDVGDL